MPAYEAKLFVIAAPSGAGKTTLVHRLMADIPELKFSISYTTRKQRRTETDGMDYFFVTTEVFEQMVAAGEFLEHALVFDNYYGTSKTQVMQLLAQGHSVILEIDWQGAQQVRRNMPECESIFILPPSVAELQRRLRGRATDSEEVIARRYRDALADLSHWDEFDYAVINDNLEQAIAELKAIIAGAGDPHRVAMREVRAAVDEILAGRG
jgi:guanylate kinase